MAKEEVYIVGAARTAIGNFSGALSSLSAAELGAAAVREALERAAVKADQVDEVIMGQVLTAGRDHSSSYNRNLSLLLWLTD